MFILTWEKISVILLTWVCDFLPFNRLGNEGGGAKTQGEGVGIPIGGIESSIGSSPSELSTSLEGSPSIVLGFTSTHEGDKEEGAGEGSSFAYCSPTWVSTFFPDLNEITTLTFRTSLGSKEDEDPSLGLASSQLGKVPFSMLNIAN